MALIPRLPPYSFSLPWFMFDIDNKLIITSKPIPKDITDNKAIVITEVPVPGLGYEPVSPGGMGNRHVSFTIPVISKNNTIGNSLLLKEFDMLRHPVSLSLFDEGQQFVRGPKVLYWWGTGSLPQVYYVTKCNFKHKASLINQLGFPQWTDVAIELILDEEHFVNIAEDIFRKITAHAGSTLNTFKVIASSATGMRPY